MTPAVVQIILSYYHARRRAGARAIWRCVRDKIRELHREAAAEGRQLTMPTPKPETVRAFLRDRDPAEKLARKGGLAAWDKQARPVCDYEPAEYANHVWQLDHTQLDIWAGAVINGRRVPIRVWLTVALDVYSRAVAGFVLSAQTPNAWTTALLLRQAVLPKDDPRWGIHGQPAAATPDHGRDFRSHAVGASTEALGIILTFCPPHYPDMKGEIERWFRSLNTGCLAALPGYTPADGQSEGAAAKRVDTLLSVDQLRREIARWIVEDYHTRRHGTTRRTPAELWQETVRLRVPDRAELDVLLLKADETRVVGRNGIRFTPTGAEAARVYRADALVEHWRRTVTLRYNPEDLDSVLVYCDATGEFLCEAWADGRVTPDQIKQSRQRYRRGLAERLREYHEVVARDDRRRAYESGEAWNDARAAAARLGARDVSGREARDADRRTPEPADLRSRSSSPAKRSASPTRTRGDGSGTRSADHPRQRSRGHDAAAEALLARLTGRAPTASSHQPPAQPVQRPSGGHTVHRREARP
jgi:putative transposase